MQRLFVALWPPDAARDALAQWQARWTWPAKAARVRPERLHVTLHFLGDTPEERLPALREALRVAWVPATLAFGHGQVWPGGIAVAMPGEVPPQVLALRARLGESLQAAGFPVERRPWRPHVTLARRAFDARPPAGPLSVQWPTDGGYVLVRTMPGTGRYEVVERFG